MDRRPAAETSATQSDAAGLRGSEQRFSTTTRSAPASARSSSAARVGPVAPMRETRAEMVGRPVAGDGEDAKARLAEGPVPLRGLDRHAVGAAEPERDDRGGRRPVTRRHDTGAARGATVVRMTRQSR